MISRYEQIQALLIAKTGSDAKACQAKLEKMQISPFFFMRGSADLFYQDIAAGLLQIPESLYQLPATFIMGDCHLSNFGFFSEEGSHGDHIIFAPNDFDDACHGPAIWDICRFLVSIELAAADCLDISKRMKIMSCFLSCYRKTCQHILDKKIDYYQVVTDFKKVKRLHKRYLKACRRAAFGEDFLIKSSLAKAVDLQRFPLSFKNIDGRFQRLAKEEYHALEHTFAPYVNDTILDIVQRLDAGTGSLNMLRYYLLVGPNGQINQQQLHLNHIVEIKQQRVAAPINSFPALSPINRLNPAHLTVLSQRYMQRNPDLILNDAIWQKQHWLIRSRHHARVSIDPTDVITNDKALKYYVKQCAISLALAHARGDRRSNAFEQAVCDTMSKKLSSDLINSVREYCRQLVSDHRLLSEQSACY
ncbi:DUF2252 family protein [Gayadomonas joobiniege]|uniref:DUF2252 family protein n=1 Tax=Gayadomonas joobiniege TaxID=1234606 RepID=UPI0003717CDD|nr:DUF2252 family protein [Gayadomonas joobiniege]